jgi:hypothetical protein
MGSALGAVRGATSGGGGGGKSAPPQQNAYGSAYQPPPAQFYQPSYGGGFAAGPDRGKSSPPPQNDYGNSYQPPGGGKSSGLGQGGYGNAPAFNQPTAQTQPSFTYSLYGPADPSTYTTSYPPQSQMGMPMMGGKSSGLGQGGYGMAPGFGNMANNQEFNLRMQGSSGGAQMQAPTREAYDSFMERAKFAPGTQPTYEQWAQSQTNRVAEQAAGAEAFNRYQQQSQGRPGTMSPEMQDYYARDRAAQAGRVQRMQGMLGGQQTFAPPQPQFNPYQSPGGYGPQQGASGLQALFDALRGQQITPQRPMPQYGMQPGSGFRPDMARVQQNLKRVQPSVQKQRQDEQAERIKQLEEELNSLRRPSYE